MGKTITILIIAFAFNISAQNITEKSIPLNLAKLSLRNSYTDSLTENYRTHYSGINITSQAVVGEGIAIGFSIIPFGFGFLNSLSESGSKTTSDILGVVGISAYIVGTATGVHWIAHIENKKHSFGKTLMFSAIGAGVGAVLAGMLASKYTTIPDAGVTVIMLCPLAGSLVYSLAYADWPEQNAAENKYEVSELNNKILSFKDVVIHSQILKVNILHIKL